MRTLSARRMERWLDRETEILRRGRRYGLCCMAVGDGSAHGKRYLLGEAIPAVVPLGGFAAIRPIVMTVTTLWPGMTWAGARRGKLRRSDTSAHLGAERHQNRQRKLRQAAYDDRAAELAERIHRVLVPKIQVGAGSRSVRPGVRWPLD